jgi:hypothetical protein
VAAGDGNLCEAPIIASPWLRESGEKHDSPVLVDLLEVGSHQFSLDARGDVQVSPSASTVYTETTRAA